MDRFQALFLRLRQTQSQRPSSIAEQLKRYIRQRYVIANERGATGIEYALIACFIAIAITVGTSIAGNGLNQIFYVIGNKMMISANTAQGSN